MFAKSVVYSSLLALALGKPIARRGDFGSAFNVVPLVGVHDGNFFDVNSQTIVQFDTGVHSFNNFGGLSSLNGFDSFYGVNNFCGVQNVFVQENVVTCQVTQVSVIQQHLAIVAEYAKKIILTQSCETEAQVVLFNQWLGNLFNFNDDLRRVHGRAPTFDAVIANQIPSLVDISGNINTVGFDFSGSSIGSHGVSVIGGNWHEINSPISVGLTWERVILAAGPSIHLGNDCSSCVVSSVHETQVFPPHETQVFNQHETVVFNTHEQVFNPHETVVFTTHEQVFNPHETQVFNPHETVVFTTHEQVFNPHETVVFNPHETQVFTTHETFNPHETVVFSPHETPVFDPHATTIDENSTEEVFRKGSETSSAEVSSATEDVGVLSSEVSDDAADAESDGFPETPDDPALGRRSLPAAVARRAWASRRRS